MARCAGRSTKRGCELGLAAADRRLTTAPAACAVVAMAWVCAAGAAGPARRALPQKVFFTSKMIPKVGDRVRLGVTLTSTAEAPLLVPCTVELRDSSPDQPDRLLGRQTVTEPFSVDESRDVAFEWQPQTCDWHQLTFTVASSPGHPVPAAALRVRVPVVTRDLYFAWFGSPTAFRWCNVPTTAKDEAEGRLWLRRGAWPCHWKGGVCYKEWPTERFADSYSEHDCIAIDEVGGPGEVTDKIIAAIREHKKRHPEGFVAVWYMGAHDYWRDVADVVDLFLPEIYLNYRGNHLGSFESYLRTARETGTVAQCVPGLGINIVKDEKTGEIRATPTKEDVLRQIQHLKRVAPDWPGVGFFTSGSAAPGVAEYADQLCEEYYLNPVLTFAQSGLTVVSLGATSGAKVTLRAEIANVGATPARNVRWEARWAQPATEAVSDTGKPGRVPATGVVARVTPGERVPVEVRVPAPAGIRVLKVSLAAQPGVTLLDAAVTHVLSGLPGLRDPQAQLLALPPTTFARTGLLVSTPFPAGQWQVSELGENGRELGDLPAAVRSSIPGGEETRLQFAAPGTTAAGKIRYFLVQGMGGAVSPKANPRSPDARLQLSGRGYAAELDCDSDALISLRASAEGAELLKTPWTFKAAGYGNPGPATVTATRVGTQVVIPFESPTAKGLTRYTFYADSPAIEIARRLQPLEPLEVDGAGEGAGFAQKGGVFACQPGVGGPVNRGQLNNSDKYRDLLFGYLGEAPRPDNADKAGWLDFSWAADLDAGLGVVIAQRWRDAATASYDVTRYYDAADWIQLNHVWGTKTVIERDQESLVYLLPHGYIDVSSPDLVPPAQALWESIHAGVEVAN